MIKGSPVGLAERVAVTVTLFVSRMGVSVGSIGSVGVSTDGGLMI